MTSISSLSLQQQVLLLQQQQLAAEQSSAANKSASSATAASAPVSLANGLTGTSTSGLASGSLASFIDAQDLQNDSTSQTTSDSDSLNSLLDQEAGIPTSTTSSDSGWSAINQSAGATSSVSADMQAFLNQIGL